jgi:hypothetical protein
VAFTRSPPRTRLIVSIDMPAGSPQNTFAGKDVYARPERAPLRALEPACRAAEWRQPERADEGAAGAFLRGRRIDLLFIDADHRYQGVRRDFELYSPLCRTWWVIGFHDIVDHKHDVGVDRF